MDKGALKTNCQRKQSWLLPHGGDPSFLGLLESDLTPGVTLYPALFYANLQVVDAHLCRLVSGISLPFVMDQKTKFFALERAI